MKKIIMGVGVFLSLPMLVIMMMLSNSGSKEVKELKLANANDVPVHVVRQVKREYGREYITRLVQLGDQVGYRWGHVNQDLIDRLDNTPIRDVESRIKMSRNLKVFESVLTQMFESLEYFPVPEEVWIEKYYHNDEFVSKDVVERKKYPYALYDDFGEERFYKEKRPHYGNDLVADEGVPLVSMTSGTITKFGWNEHGGWRIGITTKEGAYFYYAHMSKYADGLYEGRHIEAGELIGYIGDSGYGPEGTTGMFIVHLHFQIGVQVDSYQNEYLWMDPQTPLRLVEENIEVFKYVDDVRTYSKPKSKKKKKTDEKEESAKEKEENEDDLRKSMKLLQNIQP